MTGYRKILSRPGSWIALIITLIVGAASCLDKKPQNALPDKVSYNFDVRPILSDKCFACHGPDGGHRKAGLRLDNEKSAFAPLQETKGAFAIVAGDPASSELYKRITSTDTSYQMPVPSSHLSLLNEHEIAIIKKWILQGGKYERHWAFTPPVKSALPEIEDTKWARNEIDYFIYEKMRSHGLSPNPVADKSSLLKRACMDITGLPPTIEQMDSFETDQSPDAFEKVVDRLIASPAYGEKMSIHWLDVSRYADSYGYQDDNIRTQWPYRDWLIHAYNDNIPYDKFITMQLAGDLLPGKNKENILATAFLRNHKYTEEGGVIEEEYRVEYLVDKTKTYSKAFLGLTVECAQCHDHKYDPVSQEDYYRLYGFFNTSQEKGYEGDVGTSKPAKTPVLAFKPEEINSAYSFIQYKDTGALTVSVMKERDTLRKTYILGRGQYTSPGKEVQPAALKAVMEFDTTRYPRNRLGLAEWTVNKKNPLTARVFVNQLWQEIFGTGLVKTASDFGMQGELPTHPALLDWLAVDFMDHDWNIKYLVKKMIMSATYQQSAVMSPLQHDTDPDNVYYSRASRTRLSAELARDLVLSSSGLLVHRIGGPSVKPYQPDGLWEASTSGRGVLATYNQDHGDDLYRRGMYTFIKLTLPPPYNIMMDGSNRDQCEVKRLKTNTPLQALIMMNDPTVLEASRVLAEKLVSTGKDGAADIPIAFRRIVLRKAKANELKVLTAYYNEQLEAFRTRRSDPSVILDAGEYAHPEKIDKNAAAALMKTISLIYNLEETLSKV